MYGWITSRNISLTQYFQSLRRCTTLFARDRDRDRRVNPIDYNTTRIIAMFKMSALLLVSMLLLNLSAKTMAGPFAVAACYSVCGSGWTACYAAAGLVAGTVTAGVGVPAAALAFNAAMATCYAACTGFLLAPTL